MKILVIEDEPSVRLGISYTLDEAGHKVSAEENGVDGIKLFGRKNFDVVITDLRLPGADGIEVLKSVKAISSDVGVIVITAFADVKTAVSAMKEGAYDYISKPFEPAELLVVLDKFQKQKGLELENIRLKEKIGEKNRFQRIIGKSPEMQRIFETIETIARTFSSVIIYGESGTGKELVANAIHDLSSRENKMFFKLNCSAIPETLIESELFGHEKGAFTGAAQRRKGKFEAADGGTIFFDEIGCLPLSLQPKLLRVLESKAFERLGGNETISVDVNTIFATGDNLLERVKEKSFREDLYYRLNVLPITIPPLRERREDIPMLIDCFLKMFEEKTGKSDLAMAPATMDLLLSYNYPGNIRELEHGIETAVTFSKGNVIEPGSLPVEIREAGEKQSAIALDDNGYLLTKKMRAFEKEMIAKALKKTDGRKKEAARNLGISRETLWRKLKEHNLASDSAQEE